MLWSRCVGCLFGLPFVFFFFFNDTATTEIYTLSLHDALPIWLHPCQIWFTGWLKNIIGLCLNMIMKTMIHMSRPGTTVWNMINIHIVCLLCLSHCSVKLATFNRTVYIQLTTVIGLFYMSCMFVCRSLVLRTHR